ncbi:MAG: sigma-70 family RNA polymerase sigma factor [Myxococcaceae bacterium]
MAERVHGVGPTEAHAPPGFLPWVAMLVHAHRERLLAFARRRGLDVEEALDAVQDSFISFLQLPQARAIAREPEEALKFLSVILRHNVMNRQRKVARHARAALLLEAQAATADVESSESLVARAEELARVNGCILRMARLQRSVIMLSLLDEQPREEVARTLGVSPGYVRVLLHRAREHVRSCEDGHDDGAEAGKEA